MRRPSPLLLPVLALLAAIVAGVWAWPNHAGTPPPPDRFPSLSFAPFHRGETPLSDRFPTGAEAAADMALVAPHTHAIRTYAAAEGDYDTAALAQANGLKLWQGIWLGADRTRNAAEIARGIAIANRYPDTVDRLVVGNEVLLRRDLPPGELVAALDQVRAAVRQTVTYADVWSFWEEFPEIARHVDVVTIHLLPYWEDQPVAAADAVAHVIAVTRRIAARFPGQRVAIGEVGWPSRGRQREGAVAGRREQAAFLAGVAGWAEHAGVDVNFIEAFDQDWKYHDEGVIGANWGLWTSDRQAKYPSGAPVLADPGWPIHALASVLLSLGLLGATLLGRPGLATGVLPMGQQIRLACAAFVLGTALAFAYAETLPVLYDTASTTAGGVNLLAQLLLAILLMRRLVGSRHERSPSAADTTALIRSLLLPTLAGGGSNRPSGLPQHPVSGDLLDHLAFLFTWTAAVLQLLLVFDPRYRDFPLPAFAVPLAAILIRALARDLPTGGGGRQELALGLILVAGAVASAVREGPLNQQSLLWNACAAVLAIPPLLRLRRG